MNLKRTCQALMCTVAITAAVSLSVFAYTAKGGTVTAKGALNLRSGASTSNSVVAKLPSGSKVLVTDQSGSWYQVSYNGKSGYVSSSYLSLSDTMDVTAGYAKVTASTSLHLRQAASTSSASLGKLRNGTTAKILGVSNGWVKVNYGSKTGYLSGDYVTVVASDSTGSSSSGSSGTTASSNIQVTSSGRLNMRKGPGTSYAVVTKLNRGTVVKLLSTEGSWYQVSYGSYTGYISAEYGKATTSEVSSGGTTNTGSYDGIQVTSSGNLNMRKNASTSTSILTKLRSGAVAKLLGTEGNWYKVSYGSYTGYVSASYCKLVNYQSAANNSSGNSTGNNTSSSSLRSELIDYAKTLLGSKYVYGGSSPSGFDCSGYTTYVFKHFGYSLSRSSSSQYRNCKKINKSELKPGDLVFFSNGTSGVVGHAGIYIGNNNFIHSENRGTGVCISSMASSYYSRNYIGSGRVIFD